MQIGPPRSGYEANRRSSARSNQYPPSTTMHATRIKASSYTKMSNGNDVEIEGKGIANRHFRFTIRLICITFLSSRLFK